MADGTHSYNPFVRRTSHSSHTITAYRVLAALSWLLVVVFGVYYSARRPDDVHHGSTLGKQADVNPTPFSQTKAITIVYWVLLLLSQIGYLGQLWSNTAEKLAAAANVAPYFILNNLFVLSFILLWTRSHFWAAEIFEIASLINQGTVYWSYPGLPLDIHLPAIAGPYAWSITSIFWTGAVAVGGNSLPKRIVANVFIWVMYVYGQAHIAHRSDQILGYSLSLLTLSLALKQFSLKIISLQWIFSFIIFGLFLITSMYSSGTNYYQRDFYFRPLAGSEEDNDAERQRLLPSE